MKGAAALIAIAMIFAFGSEAWALPPGDFVYEKPIIEWIPPSIEEEGGSSKVIEELCSPQDVLSDDKSDYVAIRQCDEASCIIKIVGRMMPDKDFWVYYGKSGDFIAHLFAGTTNMYYEEDNLSFHCAPGPAELGQYFICIAATSADRIPPTPAIRILVIEPDACGYSPVKALKEDADGNNIADDDEGIDLPQVPLESIEDEEEGEELVELDQGTQSPPQFTPPAGGYDEGAGCNALPGAPANPMAHLIISLGLAMLAWRRRH